MCRAESSGQAPVVRLYSAILLRMSVASCELARVLPLPLTPPAGGAAKAAVAVSAASARQVVVPIRLMSFPFCCRSMLGVSGQPLQRRIRVDRHALPPALLRPQPEDREVQVRRVRRRVAGAAHITDH